AGGVPVGPEPAVQVVADHRAGGRVDERDAARVVVGLAPPVAAAGTDRQSENFSVRGPVDGLHDLIERRTRQVDALRGETARRCAARPLDTLGGEDLAPAGAIGPDDAEPRDLRPERRRASGVLREDTLPQ